MISIIRLSACKWYLKNLVLTFTFEDSEVSNIPMELQSCGEGKKSIISSKSRDIILANQGTATICEFNHNELPVLLGPF